MDTRSRLLIGVLAAGALAVVTGCGSSSSGSASVSNPFGGGGGGGAGANSSGAGAPLDACTAMSASTASQISGGNLTKAHSSNAGGTSECVYVDSATGAGAAAVVENLPGLAGGQSALQAAMSAAAAKGGNNTQPVSGVGDVALKEVDTNGATVAFAKGSTLVVLTISGSTRDGNSIESDLENLARQLAGQL